MLQNTLILPETDARLAASMLQDAIDSLTIVLMLVFGKEAEAKRIVDWADQLANKTRITDDFNLRKIVWIRDDSSASIRTVLDPILGRGNTPRVAVLNFSDELKATLTDADGIKPTVLEKAFLQGHAR